MNPESPPDSESQPMRLAAFAPDLMDQSKIKGAYPEVQMIRSVAKLEDLDADVVLVDLSRPGVLDAIGALSARVIGFGSHVDEALLTAAEAAGCDEVLPRSVFFKRLTTRNVTAM